MDKVKMEDLDDWGYQPFLGLTYAFSDRVMLGVVYRAEMDVDLEGDLKFRGVPLPGGDVKLSWDNPQWLEAALRFDLDNNYYVATNLGWQDWSQFSENALDGYPGGHGAGPGLERYLAHRYRLWAYRRHPGVVLWPVLRQLTGNGQEQDH